MVRHSGETERISARNIVIAAGARPFVPPIPGIEQVGYLTSDMVWELRQLPRRLLILGGGPIGCEPTQTFARFSAAVTQVEMAPRIMIREDPEVSELVMARFRSEDIAVLVNHRAKEFIVNNSEKILISEHAGEDVRIPFDALLVAVGQVANLSGYGLDELGIVAQRTKSTTSTGRSRWGSAWLHQGADRTGQGPPPRRHPRWRTRRRPDCRIRAGDAARHRSEQDPWHHPHLSDTCRSQQVRRR